MKSTRGASIAALIPILILATATGALADDQASEKEQVAAASAATAPATVSWATRKAAAVAPQPKPIVLEMSPLGGPAKPPTQGVHAIHYAGYVGSQALDLATTGMALSRGATEMNPIMRVAGAAGPGGLLIKAVTTWGVIQVVKKLSRRDPKIATASLTAMTAINTAAAANNLGNFNALR